MEKTPIIIPDDEIIDYQLAQEKKVRDFGMQSLEHFNRYKWDAAQGMTKFGDNFERALGDLLFKSQLDDSIKIMKVWQNKCSQYEMVYRIFQAKENASARQLEP